MLPSLRLFWEKNNFSVRAEEYDDAEKEEEEAEEEEEENASVKCSADAGAQMCLRVSVVSLVSQLRGNSLSMQFSPLAFFISCLHGACSGSETTETLAYPLMCLLAYFLRLDCPEGRKNNSGALFFLSFLHFDLVLLQDIIFFLHQT